MSVDGCLSLTRPEQLFCLIKEELCDYLLPLRRLTEEVHLLVERLHHFWGFYRFTIHSCFCGISSDYLVLFTLRLI